MWTCEKCYEEIEDTFDTCWKCSSNKLTSEKEEATELTSEKKTNWSVNKKYYVATVFKVSILSCFVLFCYLNSVTTYPYYGDLKAVPQYSIPISIFLIYISEYKSTKLKTETTKAIITTFVTTILVYALLDKL